MERDVSSYLENWAEEDLTVTKDSPDLDAMFKEFPNADNVYKIFIMLVDAKIGIRKMQSRK